MKRYFKHIEALEKEDESKLRLRTLLRSKFKIELDEHRDLKEALEDYTSNSHKLRIEQGR